MKHSEPLPVPKFAIGQTVYSATVERAAHSTTQCPDCLGFGTWKWSSPAGDVGKADCPRCGGLKVIDLYQHTIRMEERVIESIRIDTSYSELQVWYRFQSMGDQLFAERNLFGTKEEAEARKLTAEDLETNRINKGLSTMTLYACNAYRATVEQKQIKDRLRALEDRILEMGLHIESGEPFNSHCTLAEGQRNVIQEYLLSVDEDSAQALNEWRG